MLAEGQGLAVRAVDSHELDLGDAVGQLQGRLQRVGETPLDAVAAHETIDDDFNLVLLVPRQALVALQELGDVDHFAVDSGADVALAGEILQQRVVVTLATAHDRREHLESGAVGQQQDSVDNLLRSLALQPGSVVGTVLHADAGIQQPQVVVDLGDRAHRRAGVAAGRLLIDGDSGRQTLDHVDVGFVHLPEELSGIGAEALDIPPLSLGVDRVEGQAALPGTR